MARLHSLIVLVAITGTAFAQSKRYPAPPKDADKEAEAHSRLWESALDPERKPYDGLVAEAEHLLEDSQHPVEAATAALAKLDQAIERLPKDYRARALRGHAFVLLKKWDKCADELALADTNDAATSGELETVELELGICQARAGKLGDAERTLVHLVTIAPKAEPWLRLGEVRIALGKLDEAVDALSASLETVGSATAHWLLGLAYDRARKSNAADSELQIALRMDPTAHDLQYPKYPWLRTGEADYMFGLAKQTSPEHADVAMPEVALVYFKRFLRAAPDSPWRRRAEEHVKDLSALPFPLALKREPQSSAFVEPGTLVPLVQKAMPALRACAAKLPSDVFVVTVVRAGPKETNVERPRYAVPASSTRVALYLELDTISQLQEDAAITCMTPIASRIPLPSPKERDTYYQMSFLVVAP